MTRQHTYTALILVLCICTLSHEFGNAARLRRSAVRQDDLNNNLLSKVTAVDKFEDKAIQRKHQSRHKRSLTTILLATTLTLGYASIGFETYLAIEGCCGLYKEICENEEKFRNLQETLKRKSQNVDADYLAASNVLEYVKQCNHKNHEIWIQLNIVKQLSEDLILTIDDSLMEKFQKKQDEIQREVSAKNATVLAFEYEDLDIQYKSLYDSTFGRLVMAGKLLGWPAVLTAKYAYKQYQINQIEKVLRTEQGRQLINAQRKSKTFLGLTDNTVNKYLRETATSQYESSMAYSKMASYFNVASNLYSVFATGFDIYYTIKKVDTCQEIRDKTRDAYEAAVNGEVELDELQKNVSEYRAFVDREGWAFVKDQITGDEVTAILETIANLTEEAGTQALRNISKTINHFIAAVPNADFQTTLELQTQLMPALDVGIFCFKCHLQLAKLVQYVIHGCKIGLDPIHKLYAAGFEQYKDVNSQECHDKAGTPYTSEADILKLVEERAEADGFQSDCILNDENKKALACDLHYMLYTDEEIALKMGLTEAQVGFFTNNCPLPTSLQPQQMNTVCLLRQQGESDDEIATAIGFPELRPLVAAHKCPTEPPPNALPQEDQEKVCALRGYGIPDNYIAQIMDYDPALVGKVTCT